MGSITRRPHQQPNLPTFMSVNYRPAHPAPDLHFDSTRRRLLLKRVRDLEPVDQDTAGVDAAAVELVGNEDQR